MIEHNKIELELIYGPLRKDDLGVMPFIQFPHECTISGCPGNINRLKLEMWDEMLAALERTEVECNPSMRRAGTIMTRGVLESMDASRNLIARAKELK